MSLYRHNVSNLVVLLSAQIEALPKAGHARRRSGAWDTMQNHFFNLGPIGRLSALLARERVHRQMKILVLNSASGSQKCISVRNWRCSS